MDDPQHARLTAVAPAAWRTRPPVESVALLAAFVLTVLDATATHTWIVSGIAAEANPLLRSLMEQAGSTTALALRVALGGALLLLLRSLVDVSHRARAALFGAVAVLGGVGVWHLQGVVLLTTG